MMSGANPSASNSLVKNARSIFATDQIWIVVVLRWHVKLIFWLWYNSDSYPRCLKWTMMRRTNPRITLIWNTVKGVVWEETMSVLRTVPQITILMHSDPFQLEILQLYCSQLLKTKQFRKYQHFNWKNEDDTNYSREIVEEGWTKFYYTV